MSVLVLKMPRRLETPNVWNGRHWRTKHRISQEWEKALGYALLECVSERAKGDRTPDFKAALMCAMGPRGVAKLAGEKLPPQKYRVQVERHVPSKRNFIRDDDNCAFSVKPLLDALKRMGFIYDDSRKWLESPIPTQHVSADGKDWTMVRIEALGE